jgi:hypothetical protein
MPSNINKTEDTNTMQKKRKKERKEENMERRL